MNARVKKKWLRALRSGKYKQGRGQLHKVDRDEHRFCCLGVLCDLYVKEHKQKWEMLADNGGSSLFKGRAYYLPECVRKWAGMDSNYGKVSDCFGKYSSLTKLNDAGKRFSTIANVIQEHL